MAAAGIGTCYVPDDQFAVIPRHLAEAYFLLESGAASSVASLLPTAPELRQPVPDLHAPAVRKLYGHRADADAYVHVCSPTGATSPCVAAGRRCGAPARNLTHLFETYLGGAYSVGTIHIRDPRQIHRALCCEARLGLRLVSRLVPVRFSAFLFNGAGGGAALSGIKRIGRNSSC